MSSSRVAALKNKNLFGVIKNPRPIDAIGTSSFTSIPWTKRKISQLRAQFIDTFNIASEELPTESLPIGVVLPHEPSDEDVAFLEDLEDIVDVLTARIADDEQGEGIPYSELRKKLGFTDKWPTE